MTTTTATQTVRLNYKDRDYEFSELPRTAQLILQDMLQLDNQINQLQFELRHLKAARQVYSANLLKSMSEQESAEFSAGDDANNPATYGTHSDNGHDN